MASLRNHVKSKHVKIKDTPCDEKSCELKFTNTSGMKKHWNHIHGDSAKLHFCTICEYFSELPENVTKHEVKCKKRTGKRQKKLLPIKPIPCHYCGKAVLNQNEHLLNCKKAMQILAPMIADKAHKVNYYLYISTYY